jgi:hypothetical protein
MQRLASVLRRCLGTWNSVEDIPVNDHDSPYAEMGFEMAGVLKEQERPATALTLVSHLLRRGDFQMTRREQELLDKQLWGVSSKSPQDGIIILIIVAVFLVGMGIGDIVSKTKQANTHSLALITYQTDKTNGAAP